MGSKFQGRAYSLPNPAIVKLYLLLRENHPEFGSAALAKEHIFRKLFPGRAYDHQKMLNLMSDFMSLLEQYLVALQLEADEQEQKKLLVQAYSERPDCYDIFEKKVLELDKFLDAKPYRDELYFRQTSARSGFQRGAERLAVG